MPAPTELLGNYQLKPKDAKNNPAEKLAVPADFPAVTDPLYEGIHQYNLNYVKSVNAYKGKAYVDLPSSDSKASQAETQAIKNRTFFREKFIAEITAFNEKNNAAITDPLEPKKMQEIFGEELTKLYKLALEEEKNDEAYMQAVLFNSTDFYAGEKWSERPFVIVAGPSASGKSYAAAAAISEASRFLEKDEGNLTGNQVISIDGGKVRETSQIRKLAIKAANNKGYQGISNLHRKSKTLEDVKKRVYHHALQTDSGIVMPETFSYQMIPTHECNQILTNALKLKDTKVIFTRTEGKDEAIFQEVVKQMGSSRAWKSKNFDQQADLTDLNENTDSESKKYGPEGYQLGVNGSKVMENRFKKQSKHKLNMIIINDLLLKKKEGTEWVDAKAGEPGVKLVSERVFNIWQNMIWNDFKATLKPNADGNLNAETIAQWQALKEKPDLAEFADKYRVPSLIKTSAEMQFAVAKEELHTKILKLTDQVKKTPDNKTLLESKYILEQTYKGLEDLESTQLRDKKAIDSLLSHVEWEAVPKRSGGKKMENVASALKNLSAELSAQVKNEQTTKKSDTTESSPEALEDKQEIADKMDEILEQLHHVKTQIKDIQSSIYSTHTKAKKVTFAEVSSSVVNSSTLFHPKPVATATTSANPTSAPSSTAPKIND